MPHHKTGSRAWLSFCYIVFILYLHSSSVCFLTISFEIIMPEHLHKDELQYELDARGLSTEGLNVAALRSLFRTSRDLKVNPELLATSEKFKDPASILSFCHDRFNQIKDLVDNTDSSRVSIHFPRYIHRLECITLHILMFCAVCVNRNAK
jgi:hypothetical protein